MTLEQIKQERQAFEEFMRSQNNGDRLELDADGCYADVSIEYAWSGWKARAKQTEWIAVEEQLPTLLNKQLSQLNSSSHIAICEVIVKLQNGSVRMALFEHFKTINNGIVYSFTGDIYHIDGGEYNCEIYTKDVTHWQYLPSK